MSERPPDYTEVMLNADARLPDGQTQLSTAELSIRVETAVEESDQD
jgi:hypothetical protein